MIPQFDVVELQKVNLAEGDVLSVKLIGDDFDETTLQSLRDSLKTVFTKNKIMVFTLPKGSDIVFEAIKQETTNYCTDCNCGKKESAEDGKTTQIGQDPEAN